MCSLGSEAVCPDSYCCSLTSLTFLQDVSGVTCRRHALRLGLIYRRYAATVDISVVSERDEAQEVSDMADLLRAIVASSGT